MTAEAAAYQILRATLRGDAAGLWEEVYAERAIPGGARPYVVMIASGGSREQWRTDRENARLLYTVKVVANRLAEALDGQGRLYTLLDGQGDQEGGGLATIAGWGVLTVTAETPVNLVEAFEGTDEIYHGGYQFALEMESK